MFEYLNRVKVQNIQEISRRRFQWRHFDVSSFRPIVISIYPNTFHFFLLFCFAFFVEYLCYTQDRSVQDFLGSQKKVKKSISSFKWLYFDLSYYFSCLFLFVFVLFDIFLTVVTLGFEVSMTFWGAVREEIKKIISTASFRPRTTTPYHFALSINSSLLSLLLRLLFYLTII